ncbi:translation machinery-associated protein 16 [Lasiosphaeria hispida]|uniref:Translation machinery-associated protein 16 n=1 Tax=Lasiosphaeria hispida TaxID=260671 RepID=A0AAJ0MAY4_9PEZI|nr:translation machinery-associated protein 16 [Lasiosphaeria hispida]
MAKTLEKARKQISKKKNGASIDALHQYSRDSKRLHRAQIRDERLDKIASSRRKQDRPLLERVLFFQEFVRGNELKAVELETVQAKVNEYVHQYDEELDAIKKERRPGRPASMREDLLGMKIASLEKEQKDGFYMPDLSIETNVQLLDKWEKRSWPYLTNLKWVKIAGNGEVRPSLFPPQSN